MSLVRVQVGEPNSKSPIAKASGFFMPVRFLIFFVFVASELNRSVSRIKDIHRTHLMVFETWRIKGVYKAISKKEIGTTEWIRTTDPHHVKVVL